MKMVNVLQRLAELDSTNPNVEKKVEEKSKTPVQLEEGLDTSALKMLAGTQQIVECGMPTLGAPMPTMPATLSMSAGNSTEIVQMVRGLMDLAKTDVPSQSMMPAMGAPMPDLGGHKEPMFAEPEHGALGGATLPNVPGADSPIGGHEEPMGDLGADLGGTDATDLGGAGDDEIMDLIKKIRTGEPVKVTTDMPVKVTTDKDIKGSTTGSHTSSGDDGAPGEKDEGARAYDNSPKEKVKGYEPNSMADMRDKVSSADKEYTPPGSGDNPLPKTDEKDEEKKDESFAAKLFAEYQQFVNEGKKKPDFLDMDKDGNKKEPMKKALKDKKK